MPASVESFNKMIQTPPAARGANTDQGPATSGAVQPNNNGGTVRRSNTSSGVKPRTKGKFCGSGLASLCTISYLVCNSRTIIANSSIFFACKSHQSETANRGAGRQLQGPSKWYCSLRGSRGSFSTCGGQRTAHPQQPSVKHGI